MTAAKTFTCVSCPVGCLLQVEFDGNGAVERVSGNTCKRGESYARQEAVDPRRNVSTLVMVPGFAEPLSVKTAAPVPRDRIAEVADAARALRVEAPVRIGDVLCEDAAGTGVALLATKDLG